MWGEKIFFPGKSDLTLGKNIIRKMNDLGGGMNAYEGI